MHELDSGKPRFSLNSVVSIHSSIVDRWKTLAWLSTPKSKLLYKKPGFWSPAFQTSKKTPNTNYKSRNHTDKFASITTSTPRGAGPCCLHNSSLPLYLRQCCCHACRIPGEKRDQRVLIDAKDCIPPSWLRFSRQNRCTWKVFSYCKCILWVCEKKQVYENLQHRTSGLGLERNKMLNFKKIYIFTVAIDNSEFLGCWLNRNLRIQSFQTKEGKG